MRSGGSVAADGPQAALPDREGTAAGATGPAQWAAAPGSGAAGKLGGPPADHSPRFLPSVRLTLETGTAVLVSAALSRLGASETERPG
ncbi:hypothetical protein BX257_8223 [Streptomyces sp. 3212.3]|nr:hypothetical protein BX257_8223 [Streptomyces sp. 3212.3]